MRSVLPLAIVLLVLAAGLRLFETFEPAFQSIRGNERATTILASSRGELLPEAPLPGGAELVPDTIAIGDLLLKRLGAGPGLRVAVLHADLSLKSFEVLDLVRTPRRIDKLETLVQRAAEGAVVVITVHGAVRPAPENTAAFDTVLQGLGARVTPFRAPSASWALVSVRSRGIWRAVAEAYSETESVSLSVTLSERPEGRALWSPGELVYSVARGPQLLDLSAPGQGTDFASNHVSLDRWARVGAVTRPAYRVPAGGRHGTGHAGWTRVALGHDPRFEVQLAVSPADAERFEGAECQLVVDDEIVGRFPLDATDATDATAATEGTGDREQWKPWTVDLAAYAERTVRLELRVLPAASGAQAPAPASWVLWGEPTLTWTAARSGDGAPEETERLAPEASSAKQAADGPEPPVNLAEHALNGLRLPALAADGAHSFLVGGHLYGDPRAKELVSPSLSLLGNLDRVNMSGADYFIAQGDIVRFITPPHLEALRTSLLNELELPFWNAVGNHDMAFRKRFRRDFPQPTVGFLSHGPILHLVLDSEAQSGRIAGPQLEFLLAALAGAQTLERVKCVAIHSHKLVWVDGRPEFGIVWERLNAHTGYVSDGDFVRDVLPAVRELAAVKPVVWFSGDVGIFTSLPLFFHQEPDVDLRWVAVGLGDTADDALVQVHVAAGGELTFEVMRMDGTPSAPLEHFGVPYWKDHFARR